ncbi:glycoside hydrolase family 32 protein [Nafulsella turpanensis]|uniref:glycoside hydrolase family 32 protein n=1 Tax=Nafulsella turpanensis TaxID=1265690 RepID=UPI00034A363C|nr:glycoside hydrolase family 32 protein [Nafulsella turpanensis]
MKNILIASGLLFSMVACSDKVVEQTVQENREQHRLQFHFTPPSAWMNDPNGMVYHEGEYHLFYQHNPDSTVWGPMHWGHAVSKDLVHWEHLPIGLYPDSLGTIFSGSAVADLNNTSGLGTTENPPLVAIFTYHNAEAERAGRNDFQTQGIAFSLDKGRTWTKYEQNPVLPNPGIRDFRDPKVMWYEAGQKWVMALAVADRISFYSSKDLKSWEHESDFGQDIGAHGGVWECPDLFPLQVKGSGEEKWVLLVSINPGGPNGGSATQYFVGHFNGEEFVLDEQFRQDLSQEAVVPQGKLFADFEGENYKGWEVEGDAFGEGPVPGTLDRQGKVAGFAGTKLVNSFRQGDESMGRLLSPAFMINTNYINFLAGGGKHPEGTAVNLLVDGERVRNATGNNSESLNWVAWNVEELKGKEARLEIVDQVQGGWGHILVDQLIFADAPAENAQEGIWIDYGRDNYAGVSWSNVPEEDGRRLFMGWMSNWDYANVVPTETWRSAMTVARSLNLENTAEGLRLVSKPVEELEKLYAATVQLDEQLVEDSLLISQKLPSSTATFDLSMELEALNPTAGYAFELSNELGQKVIIGYDPERKAYFVDRRQAGKNDFSDNFGDIHYGPRIAQGPVHDLRLLIDVASLELFADGGKTVMTDIFFPDEAFTELKLLTKNGAVKVNAGAIRELRSIWNTDI